ncbi:beta-1,3-galactosyltransferase 2 [Amia ocellicauda]|uniref:beta-1,3-galactosyltransferase 2 n=1 Tax=Amia ocellicauda TaxID=2972642 RepID=UPI0034648478|nr:B3GT2 galactosyltransferase [Amia calva]
MDGKRKFFQSCFLKVLLVTFLWLLLLSYFSEKKSWLYNLILKYWGHKQVAEPPLLNITTQRPLKYDPHSQHGPFDIAYPYNYAYVLNEPYKCVARTPFLVLMVPVAPHNREARDIIRQTWGNESLIAGVAIVRIFALGLPSGDRAPQIQAELKKESQEHHDIIQKDFLDSYRNLTIKTMAILDWLVSYCPGASYAMKIDTDTFLNVDNLVNKLLDPHAPHPKQDYITGVVIVNGEARRDTGSKWYMPFEVYPKSTYPLYVSGIGYVFSLDLAKKVLKVSKYVKPLFLEDVYVGMCLEKLDIKPTYPPSASLFNLYSFPYDYCRFSKIITVTDIPIMELVKFWKDFQVPGHLCEGKE